MEHVEFAELPQLENALLVAAFGGWNDAAGAGTWAIEFLSNQWETAEFADMDPEPFYDFTETRPHVRVANGNVRRVTWPEFDIAERTGTYPDDGSATDPARDTEYPLPDSAPTVALQPAQAGFVAARPLGADLSAGPSGPDSSCSPAGARETAAETAMPVAPQPAPAGFVDGSPLGAGLPTGPLSAGADSSAGPPSAPEVVHPGSPIPPALLPRFRRRSGSLSLPTFHPARRGAP